ncbi:ankyrin repeat-containing protein At5g02620 isoform X1 [Brachypodium distachyon]|uniref:ankyrin repeat-containing protein At5g02620 isoform X1 n=1 Tax=Brachypodium distachyon TaxID=15368 RepID=UPI000D0CF444|nr:ankyrin repeat-containing protein At5g02620 isoform X1 [Brachypodium distachyon]|eukprot:XP_024315048.1 ankyrin repeat-containing protein At5g02620 isoform X1 [Brachypodium distachyon]
MAANTSTTPSSSGGQGQPRIDRRLLQAATSGDSGSMKAMASQDPSILLGTPPLGNTVLHISSVHGHEGFCKDVLELEESLLTAVNSDKETPLVAAVRSGRVSLASVLLSRYCRSRQLSDAILRQDKDGCNALHHAIRSGHRELAMELIAAEPGLCKGVDKYGESPMFIAAMRGFAHIFEKLLNIPDSSHAGRNGLHAVVENGDKDSAIKIMGIRPEMARAANMNNNTPLRVAVLFNKPDVLRVLLEHDCSLGYELTKSGAPLLTAASFRGHVDVAREILSNCPDAPYCTVDGKQWTCLHTAISHNHTEFVEFILATPQLRKLVNMQTSKGETALHMAVQKCNPKTAAALLSHEDIDPTVVADNNSPAAWSLAQTTNQAKTLNWVGSR